MVTETVKTPESTKSAIPYFVIAAFVLFAAYIGMMVQKAMRTNVELVSADYYQQELDYQDRMQAEQRMAALPSPVQIAADAAARQLTIQLPTILTKKAIEGEVHFVRPSDSKLDFSVPFRPDAEGRQVLSTAVLREGHWRVRLDFRANGQEYFLEEMLDR